MGVMIKFSEFGKIIGPLRLQQKLPGRGGQLTRKQGHGVINIQMYLFVMRLKHFVMRDIFRLPRVPHLKIGIPL